MKAENVKENTLTTDNSGLDDADRIYYFTILRIIKNDKEKEIIKIEYSSFNNDNEEKLFTRDRKLVIDITYEKWNRDHSSNQSTNPSEFKALIKLIFQSL